MATQQKDQSAPAQTADLRNNAMQAPKCGAKTRSGGVCKTAAMANGRCRMHGGTNTGAPKGNQNARKHGIYSDALLPEEVDLYDQIKSDQLEQELKIAKIQLRRALLAQNASGEKPELMEFTAHKGKGSRAKGPREEHYRRQNYSDAIQKLLGRIGDLELKRALLLERGGAGDTTPDAFEVVEYDD